MRLFMGKSHEIPAWVLGGAPRGRRRRVSYKHILKALTSLTEVPLQSRAGLGLDSRTGDVGPQLLAVSQDSEVSSKGQNISKFQCFSPRLVSKSRAGPIRD